MSNYIVERLDNFVVINYLGNNWRFKEEGFNAEGLSKEEIDNLIKEKVENNRLND